jgi:hypothetical protein
MHADAATTAAAQACVTQEALGAAAQAAADAAQAADEADVLEHLAAVAAAKQEQAAAGAMADLACAEILPAVPVSAGNGGGL